MAEIYTLIREQISLIRRSTRRSSSLKKLERVLKRMVHKLNQSRFALLKDNLDDNK